MSRDIISGMSRDIIFPNVEANCSVERFQVAGVAE